MYGDTQPPAPSGYPSQGNAPVEQLSDINGTTQNVLTESIRALDHIISKFTGPRPEPTQGNNKIGTRSALADARDIREAAAHVMERVTELHRLMGYDKQ